MPLSEVDHPLLSKAAALLQGGVEQMESISEIDDLPLKKVKVPALARRAAAELGTEQTATIAGAEVGMQVEHDDLGMAWVGIRVAGPVDPNLHAVLLAEVPGT